MRQPAARLSKKSSCRMMSHIRERQGVPVHISKIVKLHTKYGHVASYWYGKTHVVSLASAKAFKDTNKLFDRPAVLYELIKPLVGPDSITYANEEDGKRRRHDYDQLFSYDAIKNYYSRFYEATDAVVAKIESLPSDEHVNITEHMSLLVLKALSHAMYGDFVKDDEKAITMLRHLETVVPPSRVTQSSGTAHFVAAPGSLTGTGEASDTLRPSEGCLALVVDNCHPQAGGSLGPTHHGYDSGNECLPHRGEEQLSGCSLVAALSLEHGVADTPMSSLQTVSAMGRSKVRPIHHTPECQAPNIHDTPADSRSLSQGRFVDPVDPHGRVRLSSLPTIHQVMAILNQDISKNAEAGQKFAQALKAWHDFIRAMIQHRRDNPPSDDDWTFIDVLMAKSSSEEQLLSDASTYFIAGYHTTAFCNSHYIFSLLFTPMVLALGVVQTDDEIWPEPGRFIPERFLPKNASTRHPFSFQPFGFAGKRKCPGYRIVYAEGAVFLATLCRKFKFQMVEGQTVKRKYGFVTMPSNDVWVTVTKRE
ncbi:cytochrome P450 20A1-like [Saccoglossus kowalevskii]